MSLKDFKPDNPDFDDNEKFHKNIGSEIPASAYHEEINTVKIDKLSNRVTIISIIIPCLIGAILIFAYLDMKERVVDVDQTKQNQVDRISQQLEEKLNALDVKIAKNRYDLDNKLPELNDKTISIEGRIAKLASGKADSQTIENRFAKLEKRIADNTNQDKETLSEIKKNQTLFDKTAQQIKEETTLFKEEFDARLLELSDYDQQISELRKNLSLLDKKYKRLDQETVSQFKLNKTLNQLKTDLNTHMEKIDIEIDILNQELATNISRIQKDLDLLLTSKIPSRSKSKPQINIEEESLTQ